MPKLDLFIPFTKSQEQADGTVMVYGVLAAEAPDRSKEILDYERSKPYFKTWSESVRKDSFGKSFGNCRYMHQLEVAGHGTQIEFNDAQKTISIATKVSNPKAVQQIRDGELTGYSIGGSYVDVKKVGGLTRYIAEPNEYSVVDRPCLPGATFQYVKADGSSELRKFAKYEEAPMTREEVAKAVAEILKSDKIASIIQEGIVGTNPSHASYGQPVEQPAVDQLENEDKHVDATGVVRQGIQDDPAIPTSAGTEKAAGVTDELRKMTTDPVFSTVSEALHKTISALEAFMGTTETTNMALSKAAQAHLMNCKAAMASACDHLDKAIAGADSAETEGGAMQSKSGEQNATATPSAVVGSTNGIATDIGKNAPAPLTKADVENVVVSIFEKMLGTTAVVTPTGARNGNVAGTQVTKVADSAVAATATVEDDLPPAPGSTNEVITPAIKKAATNLKAQHEIPEDVQAALAGIGR